MLHVVWTLQHLIVLQPYFWCLLNISGWNPGLNVFLYIIGLTSRFWSLKTVPGYSETHDSDMRRINPHTVNRKWRKTTSCSMNSINYITNQFDLQIPHQLFAQQPTLANYSIQLHRRSELSTWFRQHDK